MASAHQIAARIALASAILLVLVHAAAWARLLDKISTSPDAEHWLSYLAPALAVLAAVAALVAAVLSIWQRDPSAESPSRALLWIVGVAAVGAAVSTFLVDVAHHEIFVIASAAAAAVLLIAVVLLLRPPAQTRVVQPAQPAQLQSPVIYRTQQQQGQWELYPKPHLTDLEGRNVPQ